MAQSSDVWLSRITQNILARSFCWNKQCKKITKKINSLKTEWRHVSWECMVKVVSWQNPCKSLKKGKHTILLEDTKKHTHTQKKKKTRRKIDKEQGTPNKQRVGWSGLPLLRCVLAEAVFLQVASKRALTRSSASAAARSSSVNSPLFTAPCHT